MFKKTIRWAAYLLVAVALYIGVLLAHGTYTDYHPAPILPMPIQVQAATAEISDSTLKLLTWNVGYCGDGAESTFFYDNGGFFFSGGKWVRPPQPISEKNLKGVTDLLASYPADFFLLQEVDRDSKRSYHIDQLAHIAQALPTYAATFGLNYNAPRVPLPVFEPWNCIGKTYGGLATFSKYVPTEAVRLQLPSAFPWPTRIFQLDRCLGVHRFKTKWGKELVVINVHNSAYDKGGKLKAAEMTFLKDLLLREYAAGHYVICGGDWNQCPPNVKYDVFMPNKGENEDDGSPTLDMAFMPDGWVWAFDLRNPTNRSLVDPYQKGKTFVTLIDYFLLSPNIRLKTVQGIDNEFMFSDHQPVAMEVVLQ